MYRSLAVFPLEIKRLLMPGRDCLGILSHPYSFQNLPVAPLKCLNALFLHKFIRSVDAKMNYFKDMDWDIVGAIVQFLVTTHDSR
jgi:hypothetical protein